MLDCLDPLALARFWGSALGYRSLGAFGSYVVLVPEGDAPGPKLLLQRVPEPKATKNRMHLDLHVADIEAEAARLITLGAARVESGTRQEHGTTWILLADPEGNELCVCDLG